MEYEDWVLSFKPVKNNNITAPNPPFDGTMLETYGEDYERVLREINAGRSNHIWTLISGDDGSTVISNGVHFVNRIGYFITEIPFDGNGVLDVVYDDGEHPDYPMSDWKYEVLSGDTRLGYSDWVDQNRERDECLLPGSFGLTL